MKKFHKIYKVCPKSGKIVGLNFKSPIIKCLLPITGFLALVWFLYRVITKPSRINYPCIQATAPIAMGFIGYIISLLISTLGISKAVKHFHYKRYLIAIAFVCLAITGMFFTNIFDYVSIYAADPTGSNGRFLPIDKPNSPIGIAKGIFPGRVAWVHNPQATSWDGISNYWWSENFTNQEIVNKMLISVINVVAGQKDIVKSWDKLFKYLNKKKEKGNVGYKKFEKIAIKVNLNSGGGKYANKTDTSPQIVFALLDQLVNKIGVPQENITLYDAQRANISAIYEHCSKQFPNVKYNQWGNWIPNKLTFSSDEIKDSLVRRLPQAVVEADYLINVAVLKRHSRIVENWTNGAGQTAITVCGKNHFGSCGNPSALHTAIRDWHRGMGTYNPIVDLISNKYLGGNTVLYIVDGLYGGDYHNASPKRWKMTPFNDHWPSSIFASLDPIAIDSVCLDFLNAEWGLVANADNYLHEAALADNPPSGTLYLSEGKRISSLGVHEHWNNPIDKKYSRNLKTGNGIELYKVNMNNK